MNNRLPSTPEEWAAWSPVICATLLFVVRNGEILLIRKKRGHGAGKINGPGGKMDAGETPRQAALRETREELGIEALDARKIGELSFAMTDAPDTFCHVFVASDFVGEPVETDEAIPLWTKVEEIPYEEMWADDRDWLPLLLKNQAFRARYSFVEEEIFSHTMEYVVSFADA